jgi:replicative DNA helicase
MNTDELIHHEKAIVGMCLIDPAVIDRIELQLGGYHFLDFACGKIWPAIVSMRLAGEPVADVGLLALRLKPEVAPWEIAKLANTDAGMRNNEAYHLGFLIDSMERSRMRSIASEVLRRCDDTSTDSEALQAILCDLVTRFPISKIRTRQASEIMLQTIEQSTAPKKTLQVETGLPQLDRAIGGFRPGQMIVLAARPSVGKSALASQFAVTAAKDGHRVLFVSLEMTAAETVSRVLAAETGLDMRSITNGQLASHEIHKARSVADRYQEIPLYIEDRRGLSIDRLASLIRSNTAQSKLGLVVVDYLGLIVGDRRKPRWESITEISNSLKTIAQTEQVPIVALCQLNREAEGEKPKLSNLRESGAIEQDADIVLLLHRDRLESQAELILAKNRNGPLGSMELEFVADRFEFRPYIPG